MKNRIIRRIYIDLFLSKATLLELDRVDDVGVIGDLYVLNNQKVFVVKEKTKSYNDDIPMTGTFSFVARSGSFNLAYDFFCDGIATNCALTAEWIIFQN